MPPAHEQYYCGREPPASDHNLVRLVIPSSALSYQRASEGDGLHVTVVVGYCRLLLSQGGASFLGGMRRPLDGGGAMPPMILMALPLDLAPPLMTRFLGAIVNLEEALLERFSGFLGERS